MKTVVRVHPPAPSTKGLARRRRQYMRDARIAGPPIRNTGRLRQAVGLLGNLQGFLDLIRDESKADLCRALRRLFDVTPDEPGQDRDRRDRAGDDQFRVLTPRNMPEHDEADVLMQQIEG